MFVNFSYHPSKIDDPQLSGPVWDQGAAWHHLHCNETLLKSWCLIKTTNIFTIYLLIIFDTHLTLH